MVMLFTEEQCLANKRHDEAWADIYHRYEYASHDQRRALFLAAYPDVDPDYIYPQRVPSHQYPNSARHRRHVKLPQNFDIDVTRLLGTDELILANIFHEPANFYKILGQEHVPILREAQNKLAILSARLKNLPPYDASFESVPHSEPVPNEATAIRIAALAEFPSGNQTLYIEGAKDGIAGLYKVFPSALSRDLAEVTDILIEFVDEALLLIQTEGKAYIERDNSI